MAQGGSKEKALTNNRNQLKPVRVRTLAFVHTPPLASRTQFSPPSCPLLAGRVAAVQLTPPPAMAKFPV